MAKKRKANLAVPIGGDMDWQCEEDLRTLVRAEEIERDPKRFAKAKALAKSKMMEMAKVASEED